jgi:hypothetical protein
MLNVIMLIVVMLNVVAPTGDISNTFLHFQPSLLFASEDGSLTKWSTLKCFAQWVGTLTY